MAAELPANEFEALLKVLAQDRDEAAAVYVQLRRRLVSFFTYRQCANPEDLADETLDRAARKFAAVEKGTEMADPLAFIFGIARNMAKEAIKRHRTMPLAENWDTPAPGESNGGESQTGLQHDCLDRCLRGLSSVDRELILEYYREDGCAKIRHREMMARGLKLSALALRLRIHRVKHRLRECVFHCVDTGIPGQSGLH